MPGLWSPVFASDLQQSLKEQKKIAKDTPISSIYYIAI